MILSIQRRTYDSDIFLSARGNELKRSRHPDPAGIVRLYFRLSLAPVVGDSRVCILRYSCLNLLL